MNTTTRTLVGVLAAFLLTVAAGCATASTPTDGPTSVTGSRPPAGTVAAAPNPRPAAAAMSTPAPGDDRPNLVVVLTDDMRADDLAHMPKTNELITRAGMRFTNAISPHPMCCPARAELVTGQYAQNNGVQHNEGRFGGWQALDSSDTVATWFADAGYHNGFIGKYLNLYHHKAPAEPGWHVWHALTKKVTDYLSFGFHDGSFYTDDYVTNRIEERTNDTIRDLSASRRPFLLYANHLAPHDRQTSKRGLSLAPAEPRFARYGAGKTSPMVAKPSFRKATVGGLPAIMTRKAKSMGHVVEEPRSYFQTKWQARVSALQSVDEAVSSLFATLAETGEADNTYVFLTSDNGYALGEHNLYRKNIPTREVLAVPLIVVGPGVPPGTATDLPVTLVDLPATLADLAGVRPGLRIDGQSFAPTLHGGDQRGWRDTTLIQTGTGDATGKQPGWGMRGVRTSRYTYVRDVNTGERLLFDRDRDPAELVNLGGSTRYAPVIAELNRRTNALLACSGRTCNRRFGPDPSPTGG